MYFRLVNHYPSQTSAGELRALVKDRAESENASGASRNSVLAEMLGPEPNIIHAIQHEDFGAWESHISNRDPSFQAYGAKVQTTLVRPIQQEIYEVVTRSATGPANFLARNTFQAIRGKGPELRKVLEERVKTSNSRGSVSSALLSQGFASNGPYLTLAVGFSDLASLEKYFGALPSDPSWGGFANALNTLVASNENRLFRIVVPFPEA